MVPGTEDSTRRMTREGLLDIFHDAGTMVIPAGCGPCATGRNGLIDSGETSISTTGRITAPREFLKPLMPEDLRKRRGSAAFFYLARPSHSTLKRG